MQVNRGSRWCSRLLHFTQFLRLFLSNVEFLNEEPQVGIVPQRPTILTLLARPLFRAFLSMSIPVSISFVPIRSFASLMVIFLPDFDINCSVRLAFKNTLFNRFLPMIRGGGGQIVTRKCGDFLKISAYD